VPCAIALSIMSKGEPMAAMFMAVNLGGDTDTLASMTGSICGALKGQKAFDQEILKEVEHVNQLDLKTVSRRLLDVRYEHNG